VHPAGMHGRHAVRTPALRERRRRARHRGRSRVGVQRQHRSFHANHPQAMMTAGFVVFGVALVIMVGVLRRRGSAKASDLGVVSEAWLAEESAAGPRRY